MLRRWSVVAVALGLGVGTVPAAGATASVGPPVGPRWVREVAAGGDQVDLGTSINGAGVAVDAAGNAYVASATTGRFPGAGQASAGSYDVVLTKFNRRGGRVWSAQFGSSTQDLAAGVAIDAAGNIDVTGQTLGTLPGSSGKGNGFVARFTLDGTRVWTRQFTAFGRQTQLMPRRVAGDADGNVYVTGRVLANWESVFVVKYDTDGSQQWIQRLRVGGKNVESGGIAATPGGGVDVAGSTTGPLPGGGGKIGNYDAFLAHYDADGTLAWIHQFGTKGDDRGAGVAVDAAGNAFVGGRTTRAMPGTHPHIENFQRVFAAEFDPTGAYVRAVEVGAPNETVVYDTAVDAHRGVYVSGYVIGTLNGSVDDFAGEEDAFLVRFAPAFGPAKRVSWVHQLGSAASERALAVAARPDGTATVAGWTNGALAGQHRRGHNDLFVAQYRRSG